MEGKTEITMKHIYLLLLLWCCALLSTAQTAIYDKSKHYQWRSMENGEWKFDPAFYYWTTHRKYSGARIRKFKVKFKESKSKYKKVTPVRLEAAGVQALNVPQVEDERKAIKEMTDEEVKRSAERNLDAVYILFEDDFHKLEELIREGLLYSLARSKGKLSAQVTEYAEEFEMITEGIAYIHKMGIGYELENAKRQQAYTEFKEQLLDLKRRVGKLALYADSLY
ncbi:MAG: DUF5045 domain-containing protein [Prevotellaceae bacterium]|nr:DUF5045 domain-containing protein [Prevotellaceae bacterium]